MVSEKEEPEGQNEIDEIKVERTDTIAYKNDNNETNDFNNQDTQVELSGESYCCNLL